MDRWAYTNRRNNLRKQVKSVPGITRKLWLFVTTYMTPERGAVKIKNHRRGSKHEWDMNEGGTIEIDIDELLD